MSVMCVSHKQQKTTAEFERYFDNNLRIARRICRTHRCVRTSVGGWGEGGIFQDLPACLPKAGCLLRKRLLTTPSRNIFWPPLSFSCNLLLCFEMLPNLHHFPLELHWHINNVLICRPPMTLFCPDTPWYTLKYQNTPWYTLLTLIHLNTP